MKPKREKKRPLRLIRRFFATTVIGGFAVVLPIGLLVFVLRFIYNTITGLIAPIRAIVGFAPDVQTWFVNIVSVLIIIAAFFLIGLIVRTGVGRKIHSLVDVKILGRIPIYSTLRDTVQQFFGKKKMPFSQVIIADVMNTRMTGFVTDEHEDRTFTIFVPTAPNPTNGFVFHVRESQLEFLDVRPEEAMRTIFGMGTGSSRLFQRK